MSRGISWEQLHDQISELLPLLDPKVAQVARYALAQGWDVRAGKWSAPRLDEALDQVTATLATLNRTKPESYLLSAVQYLLLGLLPVAVLTTHLIAAWSLVQGARRALAARAVPPFNESLRGPDDQHQPETRAWSPGSRHEAGAVAVAVLGPS